MAFGGDGCGGQGYRAYLSGADEEAICTAFSESLLWHRQVGGGVLAVTGDTDGCLAAETSLFNAKRCLLALRNGESVDATMDWLSYHAAFGVNGILIFDRAAPGEDEGFASELEERLTVLGEAAPLVLYVTASRPMGRLGAADARLAAAVSGGGCVDRFS